MEKINLETPERRNAVSMIMKQIDKAQEGRGAIAYDQLRELMTEWVDKACDFYIDCECFPPELRNEEVRKAFIRDMCRKYVSDRGVMLVEGEMLSEPANAPWVAKAMAAGRLEFSSYKRYEVDVLRSRNLSKASIENMDKVTSSILDGMGGSGKAGTYCRASDGGCSGRQDTDLHRNLPQGSGCWLSLHHRVNGDDEYIAGANAESSQCGSCRSSYGQ